MSLADLVVGNLALASLIGVLALVVGRGGRRAPLARALWIMFFVKLITPPIIAVPLPVPAMTSIASETIQDAASSNIPVQTVSAQTASRQAISLRNVALNRVALNSARSDEVVADTNQLSLVQTSSQKTAIQSTTDSDIAFVASEPSQVSDRGSIGGWIGQVCLVVWFVGFVFLSGRGVLRLFRFRRLLYEHASEDPEATAIVREFVAEHAPWNQYVPRVVRLPVRMSPMLFGFAMRSVIICPEELWESLSEKDRRAFLAHETAHYLRRDHWVRPLEWLVTSLYWWFPGVYFGRGQLERHEEACCDAKAVSILGVRPREYAEALLRVVDFVSEHGVGTTRLASAMQPTATLEERLRLLMKNELAETPSRAHQWGCTMACAAIWLVHPDIYQTQWHPAGTRDNKIAALEAQPPTPTFAELQTDDQTVSVVPDLPQRPSGFWNAPVLRGWAEFSFEVSGYQLEAVAGTGIQIRRGEDPSLSFDSRSLTAIAEIPVSGRVIIGDADGYVRLWDLQAGMAVSLLGRHPVAVTSLAVSSSGSVFSADADGTVIRWNMQSGQMLAQWNMNQTDAATQRQDHRVSSIRVAEDGKTVAVLCNDWRDSSRPKPVFVLDASSLNHRFDVWTSPESAVVLPDALGNWVVVDWNGVVRLLQSSAPTNVISKRRVSALVLSQNVSLIE